MLTVVIVVPLIAALALGAIRAWTPRAARVFALTASVVPLGLMAWVWAGYRTGGGFQYVFRYQWIRSLGVGYAVGVDGISLALAALTAVLFVAAIVFPEERRGKDRQYYAWFLFLDAVALGLFLSLDLLVFYVFFDLNIVGMYFLIALWGHEDSKRAALKFFLYTFAGSLVMLLGILAIGLSMQPVSFDMAAIIRAQPLAAGGVSAGFVLLALSIGLSIKTPLVPVHAWLPPAHVEAPAAASAILAGVLLKMGTYGFVRIPAQMMRATFARYAPVLAAFAVLSILYGAFVALAQGNLKRRIAYTSVNHMGYAVLGVAVFGMTGSSTARAVALTGATVEMVAHGLVTGALFLITGAFWRRGREYDIDAYGGLASKAPRLAAVTVLASFASLGLPGLVQFVGEFQIFAGTLAVRPWLALLALLGVLVTAALFLQLLQKLFLGELPSRWDGWTDIKGAEVVVLGALAVLIAVLGVAPSWLVDMIHGTAKAIVGAR